MIQTIYVRSDNVEFSVGSNTDEVLTKLIESFLNKYGYEEDTPRDNSNYSFDYVGMSAIHFHEVELKRGSSYIDSPTWIKNKHATINPKNTKDNKCFQYAIIAVLHHHISRNPQRISKVNLSPTLIITIGRT